MTFAFMVTLNSSLSKSVPLGSLALAHLIRSWDWRPKVGWAVHSLWGVNMRFQVRGAALPELGQEQDTSIFLSQIKSALVSRGH